jgi:hypothetical protein
VKPGEPDLVFDSFILQPSAVLLDRRRSKRDIASREATYEPADSPYPVASTHFRERYPDKVALIASTSLSLAISPTSSSRSMSSSASHRASSRAYSRPINAARSASGRSRTPSSSRGARLAEGGDDAGAHVSVRFLRHVDPGARAPTAQP